jgi:hypothetical protein
LKIVRNILSAFAFGAILGAPVGMASAASSHRDFQGTVVHVSTTNIKVHGIEGGKAQTLSFLVDPKVVKISKKVHGKATAEMRDIQVGDYVLVRYDQKFLGIRHADAINDTTTFTHMKT